MPEKGANADFDRVAERIFQSYLDLNPVQATWLGVHGPNDARLPDRSPEVCERELPTLQGFLHDLSEFRDKDLSIERVVDLHVARGGLTGRILRLQKHPCWRESPCLYVDDVVSGVYALLLRPFAPASKRARALLGRLKQVPETLAHARTNVVAPPAIFTETAGLEAAGAMDLFDAALPSFIDSLDEPRLKSALRKATLEARAAMDGYHEWLEGTLMPLSRQECAIGRHLYERLLVEEHALPWSPDELIAVGQQVYQQTMREMKRVASRIERGKPWSKVVEDLKAIHPQESDVLTSYASEMKRARAFVAHNRMVSIPEGEAIEVVPTPAFARPMFPYASYLAPAPFAQEQKGTYWVTTIDPKLPGARREALLRGHARYGICVAALHETYPGRHLQAVRANQLTERKLRFLFPSSCFSEGWALYCEEMMYQRGFFQDDRIRLLQLKDLLWRACRVIIDVELHTGRMGFNEAVSFLVRKARLERPNAVAEVRRYCAHPTEPMSYVAGKVLIEELLQDAKVARGDRFDLRSFHDEVLGHGTIPIELVRMEMGIPRSEGRARGAGRRAHPQTRPARAPVEVGAGAP